MCWWSTTRAGVVALEDRPQIGLVAADALDGGGNPRRLELPRQELRPLELAAGGVAGVDPHVLLQQLHCRHRRHSRRSAHGACTPHHGLQKPAAEPRRGRHHREAAVERDARGGAHLALERAVDAAGHRGGGAALCQSAGQWRRLWRAGRWRSSSRQGAPPGRYPRATARAFGALPWGPSGCRRSSLAGSTRTDYEAAGSGGSGRRRASTRIGGS